jgi:hypothetical protein
MPTERQEITAQPFDLVSWSMGWTAPAQQGPTPAQASPKTAAGDQMARPDAAIAYGFIEHQGNRGGGSVAVGRQVAENPLPRDRNTIGHSVKDPLVCLV